jgi:hypothetical protein
MANVTLKFGVNFFRAISGGLSNSTLKPVSHAGDGDDHLGLFR